MKKLLLALFALALLIAALLLRQPDQPVLHSPASEKPAAKVQVSAAQLKHDRSHLMRVPDEDEQPFWMSAHVPDPEKPRLPTAAAIVGRPSAPDAALKTAARIREIESAPATPENIQLYNQQAIVFYDQDPAAATDWLNATQGYDHLSPALASIAASVGERGHLDVAHVILETIPDAEARRSAVLDIYALRARNGQVTREQLAQAGWDTTDIEHIFTERGD
jgi:hypothetical protein